MYAINLTPTPDFTTANILRGMLEAEGFPAIATTVEEEGHTLHRCISMAPMVWPRMFVLLAAEFALRPDGPAAAKDVGEKLESNSPNPLAMPVELRDAARQLLYNALFKSAKSVARVEPPLSNAVHDVGDEDPTARIVRTVEQDKADDVRYDASVSDMERGDAWDDWHSAE